MRYHRLMVGESSRGFRVLLGALALVAACGESTADTDTHGDADASVDADGGSEDAQAVDASQDAVEADTFADAPDAVVEVEAGESGASEAGGSEAGHPDSGATLTGACEAAGGVLCTPFRWDVCPVGYEPVDESDGHLSCGAGLGWCCQAAPASTCSAEELTNCIPGKCTGCWQSALDETLTCEPGRVCCQDVCK